METPQRRRRHDGPRPTARHPDYRQLRHPFAPQPVFSDDRVAAMHEAALAVLENHGIKVLLPEAVALYARAGARVDGDMVRLGPETVRHFRTADSPAVLLVIGNAPGKAYDPNRAPGG